MNKLIVLIILFYLILLTACKSSPAEDGKQNIQIAFIADAHFQDIYGVWEDTEYKGVKNPKSGRYVNIRTMHSQLQSTRLFNESYFALLSALDDIVSRGVKHVALPGDFSDDGQPVHVKGLRKILDDYSLKHGLSFYLTTGNHDPVRPFTHDAGKEDFLGVDGKQQAIYSSEKLIKEDKSYALSPVITDGIKKWGYTEITDELQNHGFYPKPEYLYWTSPYASYTYDNYTYKEAKKQAVLNNRSFIIQDTDLSIPDASYLVEAVDGVWLLAIDANVYIPKTDPEEDNSTSVNFSGSSIGYNNVLSHKRHLIKWVEKMTNLAEKKGKTLIAFSHYPMVDYTDHTHGELENLFGKNKFQMHRLPQQEVAQVFADAGIKIHFGGHMHINDTGITTTPSGNTLYNIQSPSLVAFVPAYKLLTIKDSDQYEVETIVLDQVANFDALFPLYEMEYNYLTKNNPEKLWDKDILQSSSYLDFVQTHLQELIRLRFLKNDWPVAFKDSLISNTGKSLLLKFSQVDPDLSLKQYEAWTGLDMINDFYKLYGADEIALPLITPERRKQYKNLCKLMMKSKDPLWKSWGRIFLNSMHGDPADHFMIDLQVDTLYRMKVKKEISQ